MLRPISIIIALNLLRLRLFTSTFQIIVLNTWKFPTLKFENFKAYYENLKTFLKWIMSHEKELLKQLYAFSGIRNMYTNALQYVLEQRFSNGGRDFKGWHFV